MSTSKPQTREPLNTRQKSILIAFYTQNPYPSAVERQRLSQVTGRTMKQIQDWFSNRRRVDPKLAQAKSMSATYTTPLPNQPPIRFSPADYQYYAEVQHPRPMPICSCCHCNYYSSVTVDPTFYVPETFVYNPTLLSHQY